MRRVLKSLKRWLILGHRWLGIATGLFFATWVLSGLVMMYVPFPNLTEAARLAGLSPIAWERVRLGPDAALRSLSLSHLPPSLSLSLRGDAPVYQVTLGTGERRVVSAETGAVLGPISRDEALALARARGDAGPHPTVTPVFRDQWTVTARYDALRPFHVVALDDAAGTERYVSALTGAVALETTRFARAWNWLGSIPHWIYLTPLRARAALWRDVVLWVSGVAMAGAVSGLVLGVWRLRLRRPYASGVTPYRGMGRWHHLFGVVGGLTLLTFVASGWLSMNPNHWFTGSAPTPALAAALAGDAPLPGLDTLRAVATPATVEVRFLGLGGQVHVVGADAGGRRRVAPPVTPEALRAAAERLLPGSAAAMETLTAYDAYWYPHHDTRRLPVLRVRFDDPAATWAYLDPETGELLARLDRSGRIDRWLFAAPHRFDFAILTRHRPVWDVLMWSLNLLGAGIALTGIVLGWRRLRRIRPAREARPR
ncbi:peptidase [Methylobacterium gossipiicola]|uniref:PepSY-associated TM region n=1 Tax=Methylobacterium gossipiicola TaxID=582675 RepID=A0A1I2WES9_9HYPH|nr:peptidase [Methylobacterium gossipiicola]SFG99840.1 PepSY-associated TM region [Methylobacterium gossipiicola]